MIRSTTRLLALAGTALALTVALTACSSTASSTPTAAPAAPTAAPASVAASPAGGGGATGTAVSIVDFAFDPKGLAAKTGQELTWTNTGSAAHTVTFDTGGVDSGSLSAGATFKHTFDAAGSFTYHCNFHSSMQGTVTVTQ
ncbi:MAG: cupredoxin domain-containing protein [Chloroflexota bacterium]|nr:cupredoxin domain-containing protein [Chloroflexota bacterium]